MSFKWLKEQKKWLLEPAKAMPICWLLLLIELLLNIFIVHRVNYTEIDWQAYMQEVEYFLNGTRNYAEIKGDTGPCVYPAGFLYVYSAFYYLTNGGSNVRVAQYVFIAIYLLQSLVMYKVYERTCKLPPYALILSMATSYRIHSIYVLRLFNDPIAVLLFWLSLYQILNNRWHLGSFLFSLAVSIKMNILLYAPCLLLVYLTQLTLMETAVNLTICAVVQLILALPFLISHPVSYLKASFDLGRVFDHRWTVNYRFLPVEIFQDRKLHLFLLLLHLLLLALFAKPICRYLTSYKTLSQAIQDLRTNTTTVKKQEKQEKLNEEEEKFLQAFENQIKGNPRKAKVQKKATKTTAKSAATKQSQNKQTTNSENKEVIYQLNFAKVSQLLILPFFVTNLIGIACARSLHYQFYSWYFHSLIYLVWSTALSIPSKFLLLAVIEYCWNVYPSTATSSFLLHGAHIVLLSALYITMSKSVVNSANKNQ